MAAAPIDISVVMITRNEEKSVSKVIAGIKRTCPEAEIVVVDSSSDRTAELAEAAGARVIRQFPPQGYGPAMEKALRSGKGEVIVTLDCDDTYPVEMIPELADLVLKQGYDLVDGSRLMKGKPAAMPLVNYAANLGFAGLASVLFGIRLNDLHSGMRAYRRTMIEEMKFTAKGAALPVEMLLKPLREGYRVKVVGIDYHERQGESKMQPLDSAWWTLKRILKVRLAWQ
jgi:glycosyltransferase involved in cell wall biosynthesis